MPYRFLEDNVISDIAFDVWAEDLDTFFEDAADAVVNVMIDNPQTIQNAVQFPYQSEDESIEMLLFNVLDELIFLKDARMVIVRLHNPMITKVDNRYQFNGIYIGEKIDSHHHKLRVDVKSITLHQYSVKKEGNLWKSTITLDI